MNRLPPAVEDKLKRFQPPVDAKDFEKLCVDVFEYVLKARRIPILNRTHSRISAYGTSGDKQFGIDVRDPATQAVAQCKKHEDITTTKLGAELRKLEDYDKEVSHYFFMIKQPDVKVSLSNWIEEKNAAAQNERDDSTPYPCLPSVALPELHILGWDEIRSYLGLSTFLLWKWQVAIPAGQNFHLDGLDVQALDYEVRRFKEPIDPKKNPPTLEAVHAIESLLSTIDVQALALVGKDPLVHIDLIRGVEKFVDQLRETYSAIRTYSDAVTKIDKRDLVVVEEGYKLLNNLARQKARISAYPYLRPILIDCRNLLGHLSAEGGYQWEPDFITDEFDEQHEVSGQTFLRYNFSDRKPRWGLAYTDPKQIAALTKRIVSEIETISAYQ
ncbi:MULTISPECIES: hypothetical protein [Pseudomonas]|uniref:hypothetical protein n=1 Tax=Pseudomonas TaxID=286 RepID=UPI000CD36B75|nr:MULTISPECIES: hypothetical protein [Pseudomonas]MBD8705303.1 hypothetical protein [Pseudomonas sp. CFBP 13711]MBD8711583.1 hypothetical protein [Pseudomonas sp. CFBP 13715]MBS7414300.1 hypothetical protein [Pseudomonas syringae]SOP96878.1 hypothetical protein CFBP2118_01202 [Pseudomonas syringae pv. syringae]